MSLHFIGIRDFPVLHRQFSSPTSKAFESLTSNKEISGDSKDVLVQRLNDLAFRLVTEENLNDDDITALHIDVDRMERVMRKPGGSHLAESFHDERSPAILAASRDLEDDAFWGPFSPSRNVKMRFPTTPLKTSHSTLQEALNVSPEKAFELSPEKAALLAQEAESLREQISATLKELQARKEETNHIHDLLVTRAEKAAQRILDLELQVKDLDADVEASQSELTFLRLQLRALEVQCSAYIPFGADEELSQSIKNWKFEWADIDQRTKARRKRKDVVGNVDELRKVVHGSR